METPEDIYMQKNIGKQIRISRGTLGGFLLVAGILAPMDEVVRYIILLAAVVLFFSAFSGW